MKNLTAKIACGLLAVSLCTASLAGCGNEASIDGTAEAIVINGESVNLGVANFLLRFQQATMLSYYQMFGQNTSAIWDTEAEDGTYGDTFKKDVLESIEKMYLLKEHAADYNISLSEEEISKADAAADEFIAANGEEVLKKLGISKEDISEVLQLYTYQNKMYDPMTADVDTEVSQEESAQTTITYVKVSTAGTEKDEDGNVIELSDDEKADKRELAQKVLDQAKVSVDIANADFSTIAKEVDENLSASTVSYGSDDTSVDQIVKDAVVAMKDGELNQAVLEGTDGYYVLRLDKALDEEKTEQKKESIIKQRKDDHYNELIDGWLKDSDTKTTKAWDKVEVKDADVYTFKQKEQTESGDGSNSSSSDDGASTSSSSESNSSSKEGTNE